jgi:aspartate racemase
MRTLGIVGGLGPESTIDYYRSIIARVRARKPEAGLPHLIINSLDVHKVIGMVEAGWLDDLADYLAAGIALLVRAGAGTGCIAANLPHIVFDQVQRRSAIPLVSIVRATAKHATSLGVKKAGLLGTRFTMRATFYHDEFVRAGIALLAPNDAEQEFVHSKYVGELLKNQFLPETRTGILRIANRMKAEDGVEAIVLAGTELPLLLRDAETSELPFLDTTMIHVEALVSELLRQNDGAS